MNAKEENMKYLPAAKSKNIVVQELVSELLVYNLTTLKALTLN